MLKKKCYIYIRVSTAMQVDGDSLNAQKDNLRKYAEYQDMTIVSEFSDEGFSGKNIKGRPEFSRMIEKIESGEDNVDFVLVFKLSRFGRNAADVLNSLQIMQDYGVNLICVENGIDSSKDAGKLMIPVLSAVAEIERENICTQTMAGREQKAKEGKWNSRNRRMAEKKNPNHLLETMEESKTRYRNLQALRIPEWKARELANSRKGYWRMGKVLSSALTNKIIAQLGCISMLDYYLKVCEN